MMQKLYAHVDESGQDTKGIIFLVSVVVLEKEREEVHERLLAIEEATGKREKKWHKAPYDLRKTYITLLVEQGFLREKLFFETIREVGR